AHHATKSLMTRSRVHLLRDPRRGTVAQTVVRRAKIGTSLQNFAGNADVGSQGIVTLLACVTFGPPGTARLHCMMFLIPITGPFPYVPGHVVETVAVGRKRTYGRCAFKTIHEQVLDGKFSLPGVGHHLSTGSKLIAPGVDRPFQASAR